MIGSLLNPRRSSPRIRFWRALRCHEQDDGSDVAPMYVRLLLYAGDRFHVWCATVDQGGFRTITLTYRVSPRLPDMGVRLSHLSDKARSCGLTTSSVSQWPFSTFVLSAWWSPFSLFRNCPKSGLNGVRPGSLLIPELTGSLNPPCRHIDLVIRSPRGRSRPVWGYNLQAVYDVCDD